MLALFPIVVEAATYNAIIPYELWFVLSAPIPMMLLANCLGKATKNDSSVWVLPTHMGDQVEVSSFCLCGHLVYEQADGRSLNATWRNRSSL